MSAVPRGVHRGLAEGDPLLGYEGVPDLAREKTRKIRACPALAWVLWVWRVLVGYCKSPDPRTPQSAPLSSQGRALLMCSPTWWQFFQEFVFSSQVYFACSATRGSCTTTCKKREFHIWSSRWTKCDQCILIFATCKNLLPFCALPLLRENSPHDAVFRLEWQSRLQRLLSRKESCSPLPTLNFLFSGLLESCYCT